MHFPRSAQLGIPQPQIVVHIKQLLKCLILSNLNCLLIELTFGYCFLSALHAPWHSHSFRRQWIAMWDDAIKEQSQWRLSCCSWAEVPYLRPLLWGLLAGWQGLMCGHFVRGTGPSDEPSSGDIKHKENALLRIRKPHSHSLPWLRKASWCNYEGNLQGQGSRILVREI